MVQVVLAFNAIHLEAARRIRHSQPADALRFELLLYEPSRLALEAGDRRLWPWRWPINPLSMAVLALAARLGLVGRLRLAHLRGAGRALRLLARHGRQLELLDDGLDQYRLQPRALDPLMFAAGIPCWLFSDRPAHRAPWCARFDCRELGPLYGTPAAADGLAPGRSFRTLIVDSPGVERLAVEAAHWPHPWRLVPHPVAAKRHWSAPLASEDHTLGGSPEAALRGFGGVVVVGESLVLLAALSLCGPGVRLVVALPRHADANLWRLIRDEAALDTRVWLVPDSNTT
ncbi:MAG: hypothetical protein ACK5Q6_06980 [Cyanobacteriota bacterium]